MSPRSFWELALAAARAGERKEALRFYRRYLNFDRRNVESVSLLLDQGMKSELTALYTQLVQDEPRAFTRQRLEKASLAERLLR